MSQAKPLIRRQAVSNFPKGDRQFDDPDAKRDWPPLATARPSVSVIVISPTNQVQLVRRAETSSLPGVHVFPGGNASTFQDGDVPLQDQVSRHTDGVEYRRAAIREVFEETGILLAAKRSPVRSMRQYLALPEKTSDLARKAIRVNEIKFTEWLAEHHVTPDTGGLIPLTRWITPPALPKRFTTQMYLYMLPLEDEFPLENGHEGSDPSSSAALWAEKEVVTQRPTDDGGVEIMAVEWADANVWLDRQARGEIILYPPQVYLLTLIGQFLAGKCASFGSSRPGYAAQRENLIHFIKQKPMECLRDRLHFTYSISWSRKVMCPRLLMRHPRDGRTVLAIDKPGPELQDSPQRGGDFERVILVDWRTGMPRKVEVVNRTSVYAELKQVAHMKAAEKPGDEETAAKS